MTLIHPSPLGELSDKKGTVTTGARSTSEFSVWRDTGLSSPGGDPAYRKQLRPSEHPLAASIQNEELLRVKIRIAETGRLSNDWNGYGAERPTTTARMMAYRIVHQAATFGLIPLKVVPSAAGGLFLLFAGHRGGVDVSADVECFNSNEMTFAFRRSGEALEVWDVDPSDASAILEGLAKLSAVLRD